MRVGAISVFIQRRFVAFGILSFEDVPLSTKSGQRRCIGFAGRCGTTVSGRARGHLAERNETIRATTTVAIGHHDVRVPRFPSWGVRFV